MNLKVPHLVYQTMCQCKMVMPWNVAIYLSSVPQFTIQNKGKSTIFSSVFEISFYICFQVKPKKKTKITNVLSTSL